MEIALSNPIVVEKIISNMPVTDMLNCRNVSPLFRECAERVLRLCYNKIMNSNIYPSLPVQAMTLSLYRHTYNPFSAWSKEPSLSTMLEGEYSGMKLLFRYRELGEQEMNLCNEFMVNVYRDIYETRVKIKKSRDPNIVAPETPPIEEVMKYFNSMLSDENLTRYYQSPEYHQYLEEQRQQSLLAREIAQKHIDQTDSPFSRNFKGDPSIYNPWETKNGNR